MIRKFFEKLLCWSRQSLPRQSLFTRAFVESGPLQQGLMEYLQHIKTYILTPCLRQKWSIILVSTNNILSLPIHQTLFYLDTPLFTHKTNMSISTEFVDYYAILGLPSTASVDQIRRTVREKLDFLLDTDSEDSAVYGQCILLREIEYILCDETRRSKYHVDADYQVSMES